MSASSPTIFTTLELAQKATLITPGNVTGTLTTNSTTVVTHALTTIFVPPLACMTDRYNFDGNLQIALWDNELAQTPRCYPTGYTPWQTFSPAICPSNYISSLATHDGAKAEATCCPMCAFTTSLERALADIKDCLKISAQQRAGSQGNSINPGRRSRVFSWTPPQH